MTSIKPEQSAQEEVWQLHLRRAKGESLTTEEHKQLAAWYAKQEQQERAVLQLGAKTEQADPLQAQIDTVLTQISATTAQIQQLTAENKQLRQRVMQLEERLADLTSMQPA